MPRPHEILGVEKNADDKEITREYRRLVLKHHPDQGGTAERFIQIQNAYREIQSEDPYSDLEESIQGWYNMTRRAGTAKQRNSDEWFVCGQKAVDGPNELAVDPEETEFLETGERVRCRLSRFPTGVGTIAITMDRERNGAAFYFFEEQFIWDQNIPFPMVRSKVRESHSNRIQFANDHVIIPHQIEQECDVGNLKESRIKVLSEDGRVIFAPDHRVFMPTLNDDDQYLVAYSGSGGRNIIAVFDLVDRELVATWDRPRAHGQKSERVQKKANRSKNYYLMGDFVVVGQGEDTRILFQDSENRPTINTDIYGNIVSVAPDIMLSN